MEKVIQIVADGAPGGGTTVVLEILKSQQNRNRQAYLCTQNKSVLAQQANSLGITVSALEFFSILHAPVTAIKIFRLIKAQRPCIVHLHGLRAALLALPSILILRRTPSIYTVHGYHFTHRWLLRRSLGALLENICANSADHLVFVSHRDQSIAQAISIPLKKTNRIIRNGIDLSSIPTSRSKSKKLIVFMGRFVKQKHPLLFVELARLLISDGYQFRMIGGGVMEDEVNSLIQSADLSAHIEVTGSVTRDRAIHLLSNAEVFVSTSLWEGLPLAPMEAMAMGIPCVLSDIESHRELINSSQASFLVSNNPREYAKAIRALCEDQALQEKVAQAAKNHAQQFSSTNMVDAYLQLYNDASD